MRTLIVDDSSQIQTIQYEHSSKELVVKFNTGIRYRYFGVSLLDFGKLACAKSVGSCFNSLIKGNYNFKME